MKVVIEVHPDVYDSINEFIKTGRYRSLSEFAEVAFRNQLLLEDDDTQIRVGVQSKTDSPIHKANTLENLRSVDYSIIKTEGSTWKVDSPLWGQLNRFLPIKIACRTLAYLQQQNLGNSVNLHELHDLATDYAIIIQKELHKSDQKAGRKGADRLSTALPSRKQKSQFRYRNQFIGYLQSDGRPRGAISDLRLGVIMATNPQTIMLTEAGLEFSSLENPIIDQQTITQTLSDTEVKFIITHIKKELPEEWNFLIRLIDWIQEGDNNPNALTKQVSQTYSSWSEAVANTNRVGGLSRLSELRLVSRERDASGMRYSLTNLGEVILR